MISLSFDGSDKNVQEILRQKGRGIVAALLPTMDALDIKLQRHIQTDYLHGQVLAQRSGKLVGSIRAIPAHAEGTFLIGAVEGGGGPAWYGRLHELGGTFIAHRSLKRPAHMIRRKLGERVMTGSPYGIHFATRSFMRRGQADMRSEIEERLRQRMAEAVQL